MKKIFLIALLVVIGTALSAPSAFAALEPLYTSTADGVDLVLFRYFPDGEQNMNVGNQPVVLMGGFITNQTYFHIYTPPEEEYDPVIPEEILQSIQDPIILQDHMVFFSMAHYLYREGFDVWLASYRGQGRGDSVNNVYGDYFYSFDDMGAYDVPAVVRAVFEATGRHPFYVGHSMGGLMSYVYLQGARMELNGDFRKVVSDPILVTERNADDYGPESIRGLVSICGNPGLGYQTDLDEDPFWFLRDFYSYNWLIQNLITSPLVWPLVSSPYYIDTETLFSLIDTFIPEWIEDGIIERFEYLLYMIFNPDNTDPAVIDFMMTYVADGVGSQIFAHMAQSALYDGLLIEFFKNPDPAVVSPPDTPDPGLYRYADHMDLISLPTLCITGQKDKLVNAWFVDTEFFRNKTPHALDLYYSHPETGHVDTTCGNLSPIEIFPMVSGWMHDVMASTSDDDDSGDDDSGDDQQEDDDDDDGCGC